METYSTEIPKMLFKNTYLIFEYLAAALALMAVFQAILLQNELQQGRVDDLVMLPRYRHH